jgi:hypothetical protein
MSPASLTTDTVPATLQDLQARKTALDVDRTEWAARRTEMTARAGVLRERADGLKVQAAAATLEGDDPKSVRRERATVLAELEEVEAAVEIADGKLAALARAQATLETAVTRAAALARIDAVLRRAVALDAAWGPLLHALEAFTLEQQAAAAALRPLFPNSHFALTGSRLLAVLLWRASDLLELHPPPDANERVDLTTYCTTHFRRQSVATELVRTLEELR